MNTLDKEEFRIKLEEINHLVEKQDYKSAMSVVDSIDWRRVKNVRTLCVVGEIYAANKRFEDSREIFLLAYHRAPIGKNILYRLIEVSLKMGDIDEAMEFFGEYTEVAPNDNTQYILKYKIFKAKNASLDEQIKILEDYKEKEFTERWSYELARLYYKANEKEKCLDLCNEMVLWFSEGKYVMKALDLKLRLGSLTGAEKEKYEQQFVPKLMTPEEAKAVKSNEEEVSSAVSEEIKKAAPLEEEAPLIENIRMDEKDINNAESLQEKISKGIRDIFSGKKKEKDDFLNEEEKEENVQDEMIKDISSKDDFSDVPELEPEDGKENKKKPEITPAKEQDTFGKKSLKMPELNIPESMKNVGIQDALNIPEIPSAPDVSVPGITTKEDTPDSVDFDFNLEDTILAAATAQGIEIPDEKTETKKASTVQVFMDDEEEEILSEEDLRRAEEEFLNGPSNVQRLESENELADKTEDSHDIAGTESEPVIEEKPETDEEPEVDEKPEVDEEPEVYEESETEDGQDMEEDSLDFYDDDDEDFLDDLFEKPQRQKKPEGMNTEVFNFQEEIKKALKEQEDKNDPLVAASPEEVRFKEGSEEEGKSEKAEPLSEEEELEQFIESIETKNGRSPLDIIPRERKMTESETKMFTYLAKVPGLKEQIVDALCDAQMAASDKTSRTGNIIVMGGRETGKTRLISSLIPAICKELKLEASKVAYVFAEQINGKDITAIVSKLAGGFLVIENANQMTSETVEMLNKAMEFRTDGLTVIIEDEKIGMRKLIAKYPKFANKFTSMINIPVFTNDELVNFAKVYTKENGYTIDQMGMLALYNLIGVNQKEDEPMNVGAVKELIDSAIARSKGGIRKLKRNISKKRTDHDGFIVLYEKDFS